MLYEDPKFPERQLAALVLSKVTVSCIESIDVG
jgi:hypothetical protein